MGRFRSSSALVVILSAVAGMASGCATFSPGWDASLAVPVAEGSAEDAVQQPKSSYTVELRPRDAKWERVEVPFGGVPYVQDALEQSGAIKKFRRMDVEIIRSAGGGKQRMRSSYDYVHRRVPIEWDYALYPNDLVIVKEDTTTALDDMLRSALGPLSLLNLGQR